MNSIRTKATLLFLSALFFARAPGAQTVQEVQTRLGWANLAHGLMRAWTAGQRERNTAIIAGDAPALLLQVVRYINERVPPERRPQLLATANNITTQLLVVAASVLLSNLELAQADGDLNSAAHHLNQAQMALTQVPPNPAAASASIDQAKQHMLHAGTRLFSAFSKAVDAAWFQRKSVRDIQDLVISIFLPSWRRSQNALEAPDPELEALIAECEALILALDELDAEHAAAELALQELLADVEKI